MNLSMPKDVVRELADRGTAGATKLVDRFAPPASNAATPQPSDAPGTQPTSQTSDGAVAADAADGRGGGWENHRWIRLRAATAGLEAWLDDFQRGYHKPSASGTPYRDLAGPDSAGDLPSYKPRRQQRGSMNTRVAALLALAEDWQTKDREVFRRGAPRPTPLMRLSSSDLHTRLDDTEGEQPVGHTVTDAAPANPGQAGSPQEGTGA